jgi:hypothetical protein
LVDPEQNETRVFVKVRDRVQHLINQLPRIYKGRYRDAEAEHETEIIFNASGIDLVIRKTDSAWLSAMETWKENKAAAEKKVDYIFEDKKITGGLKTRLERLSADPLAVCEA